jgi:SAM-dependent methyltransferase
MMRPVLMSRTRTAQEPALEPPLRRFGWRRLVYDMRTEGSGPGRESAAIGVGVFIGCLPLYGLHLIICILAGRLLRLNRLKLYLAANLSNPFVAPWLLFAEVQAGSWLRRGRFHPVSLEAFDTGAVVLGIDLVVGSVAVGTTLGLLAAWGTFAMVRSDPADRPFMELVRRASDRYAATSITAWEFARGKLRGDPVYRSAVTSGLLSRPGREAPSTLVDVGCGQGLMLALLAELRRAVRRGEWQGADAPFFDRLIGIELRPNVAAIARAALAGEADIVANDVRKESLPPADVVLLFDVLHLMPGADQEALLAVLARALEPGGVMLIREADASAGWRFTAVRLGNRVKALAVRRWRQTFHFRSRTEWLATFDALGLHADVRPMGAGTPFGNVLFRVTVAPMRRS